jgi:DNA polymerase-3 subunit delta
LKLPLRQLSRQLERALAPAYLIAGAEPFLVEQALEQIRAAARAAGFAERELHVVDRSFRWADLQASAGNLSLFAARRILELRMASPRLGKALDEEEPNAGRGHAAVDGSTVLCELVEHGDPDRLLLVAVAAKLDAAAARSAWVKAFEEHGVLVQVWPVDRGELPEWIMARARQVGVELSADAAELLADRVEGNLLAADQEIRKLALTLPGRAVGEGEILAAVASSARFDVFRLSDAVLAGDSARALRVLAGLRAEGVEPPLVSWALTRELTLLARVTYAQARGENVDNALARLGVWRQRQPAVKQAVRRYGASRVMQFLSQAADVDKVIKGAAPGRPWEALTALVLALLPRAASAAAH